MRILIAAIFGAIAMFAWSALAHIVLPISNVGISQIPNEAPVLAAMRDSMGAKDGLYFFPWVDRKDPQMAEKYVAKAKTDPSGILIYHPPGAPGLGASQLIIEFAKQFVQALIAAYLLSFAAIGAYFVRVLFVSLIGVAAGITTNLSYWNWYGFPLDYTIAYSIIDIVGYIVAGFAIAFFVGRKTA